MKPSIALTVLAIILAIVACRQDSSVDGFDRSEREGLEAMAAMLDHGQFEGEVVARWLDENRTMELVEDFAYIDPVGDPWKAPSGSVVDGASIPRKLWSIAGAPFAGAYRKASVVHDVACQDRERAWKDVHRMFYSACRCGGVGRIRAKVMYWAVYHFGPRWEPGGAFVPAVAALTPEQEARFEEIVEHIEAEDPSLEELEGLGPQ